MKRDPLLFVNEIIENTESILLITKGISSQEELEKLREKIFAVNWCIVVIGEAANQLPESFTEKYPEIPWRQMADMRNRIIHQYFGIDYYFVWETIQSLPALLEELQVIVKDK
jgi:uncharacterized protein with HEPN domain